jgi:peptide/nickel transport system ATP-binding protein
LTYSEQTGLKQPGPKQPGPNGAPLLEVSDLSVYAGSAAAPRGLVRDVSFELGRGSSLAIVGESGSGKTMTARSIVGVLPEGVWARGDVRFSGTSLIGTNERAMRELRGTRIGMVLQDPFTALNPLQTIGESLRESLPKVKGRRRAATRAEVGNRLREVGLDGEVVARRYPFQLSGGMRQRVAIAAALCGDPELLIADEPTTALDVTTQAEVLALLEQLQRHRGMALLLITHNLRVAFSVAERVLVMYAGSVVEESPSADLTRAAGHPYSLGLLRADPPVTFLAAQLNAIPGSVPSADSVADQCAFADRCDWRAGVCTAKRPSLESLGENRWSSCVRIAEIRDEMWQRQKELFIPAELAHRDEPEEVPAPTAVLSIVGLSKSYSTSSLVSSAQTTLALKDVSFEIADGESLGLVGETGSGKTTLARCILGLSAASSGSIVLGGIDVTRRDKLTKAQRQQVVRLVQVVFQDPYSSLNPMLSIGTALGEAVSARGDASDVRGEVADLLRMVGLPASYAGRRPVALSGGERQRAAIARALAIRPRLLICDEPVAALDVSVQAQILELLRAIRSERGASMLFITHDLAVVRQMTDRLVVLRHGEVVESGETQAVLDAPSHPYTIGLVESIPTLPAEQPGEAGLNHWALRSSPG